MILFPKTTGANIQYKYVPIFQMAETLNNEMEKDTNQQFGVTGRL